jgi:hypothetical protein
MGRGGHIGWALVDSHGMNATALNEKRIVAGFANKFFKTFASYSLY